MNVPSVNSVIGLDPFTQACSAFTENLQAVADASIRSHASIPYARDLIPNLPEIIVVGANHESNMTTSKLLVHDLLDIQGAERTFQGRVPLCISLVHGAVQNPIAYVHAGTPITDFTANTPAYPANAIPSSALADAEDVVLDGRAEYAESPVVIEVHSAAICANFKVYTMPAFCPSSEANQMVEAIVHPYITNKNNVIVPVADIRNDWSKEIMYIYLLNHVTSATVCFVHNNLDLLETEVGVDTAVTTLQAKHARIRDQFAHHNGHHFGVGTDNLRPHWEEALGNHITFGVEAFCVAVANHVLTRFKALVNDDSTSLRLRALQQNQEDVLFSDGQLLEPSENNLREIARQIITKIQQVPSSAAVTLSRDVTMGFAIHKQRVQANIQGMLRRFSRKNSATFLSKKLLEAWQENRAGDAFQGADLGTAKVFARIHDDFKLHVGGSNAETLALLKDIHAQVDEYLKTALLDATALSTMQHIRIGDHFVYDVGPEGDYPSLYRFLYDQLEKTFCGTKTDFGWWNQEGETDFAAKAHQLFDNALHLTTNAFTASEIYRDFENEHLAIKSLKNWSLRLLAVRHKYPSVYNSVLEVSAHDTFGYLLERLCGTEGDGSTIVGELGTATLVERLIKWCEEVQAAMILINGDVEPDLTGTPPVTTAGIWTPPETVAKPPMATNGYITQYGTPGLWAQHFVLDTHGVFKVWNSMDDFACNQEPVRTINIYELANAIDIKPRNGKVFVITTQVGNWVVFAKKRGRTATAFKNFYAGFNSIAERDTWFDAIKRIQKIGAERTREVRHTPPAALDMDGVDQTDAEDIALLDAESAEEERVPQRSEVATSMLQRTQTLLCLKEIYDVGVQSARNRKQKFFADWDEWPEPDSKKGMGLHAPNLLTKTEIANNVYKTICQFRGYYSSACKYLERELQAVVEKAFFVLEQQLLQQESIVKGFIERAVATDRQLAEICSPRASWETHRIAKATKLKDVFGTLVDRLHRTDSTA
eukprot:m.1120125 g.1120125  ORF g.1120125 m.1120125 type:complete len:994 (-) comp24395_c0_seq9:555-3536(-)